MSRRGRRWLTPEQRAEQELELARALGPESTRKRLEHLERLRPLVARAAAGYHDLRALATTTGERWSWSYHARKAERELLEIDARLAALTAWLAEQPSESELRAQWGDR